MLEVSVRTNPMYKHKISIKNLFSFAQLRQSKALCLDASTPQLKFDKVLIVSKVCRYEFEQMKSNLMGHEFEHYLKSRGTNYDKLLHHQNVHQSFMDELVKVLTELRFTFQVVNQYSYSDRLVKWADVVIPAGGDGTFLLTARKVMDNKKPVIGFNSDPESSEGFLCLPKMYSSRLREVFLKLQKGEFKWLMRSRIRIYLQGKKGRYTPQNMKSQVIGDLSDFENFTIELKGTPEPTVLPALALNEVFLGESMSAKVSNLGMWLNNDTRETAVKCSGLLLVTGTGSTAWHRSINRISVQTASELLQLLDNTMEQSLVAKLVEKYNSNLVFNPEEKHISYTIRDLIVAGAWPQPKGMKPRGFCKKVVVKSRCYSANLVMDGTIAYPFNDGMVAELGMNPEDGLRSNAELQDYAGRYGRSIDIKRRSIVLPLIIKIYI